MSGYRLRKRLPSQIDSGAFRRKYHRLFMDRLTREGRYASFTKYRQELYHAPDSPYKHWDNTWWPAAREFGFISKQDEIERYEEFMLQGSVIKRRQELRAMQEEIRKEKIQETVDEVLDRIGTASEMELPADILWIYNHPAMLREPDKDDNITLTPEDMEGAPGRGAVGMLKHYLYRKTDFYKLVLAHLSRKSGSEKDNDTLEDDLRKASEIDAMLERM